MFVFTAAVVGGAALGEEIARVIAAAGVPVVQADVRGEGPEALPELAGVDFVIDAGQGDRRRRRLVFAALDAATPGHAILAVGTSGGSISSLAQGTTRPDRVIGFRLFPPLDGNRLVEVVAGEESSPQTLQAAVSFALALRRTPVRCEDAPGGVLERILTAAAGEAWRARGGGDPEEIDRALMDAGVVRRGPFAVADPGGPSRLEAAAHELRDAYGARFHVPSVAGARDR